MTAGLDHVTDLIRPDKTSRPSHEPAYTAGLSDALGDRLICFTAPGATSLELLRFEPEWADAPGFEDALRMSVEALGRLDPSLATVRAVERVDEIDGLALVSVRETGRRLSELIPRARGAAYAVDLVREIGPALAILHAAGHAHGALTPERIMVSREGRPIVLEHVLGAALGTLALTADRLRSVAGIAVPEREGPATIDARLDVIQLGLIGLSLLVGECLPASDYPGRLVVRLDQFSRDDPEAAATLRPWFENALQIGARPFANAAEALAAIDDVPAAALAQSAATPVAPVVAAEPAAEPREPAPESERPSAMFALQKSPSATTDLRRMVWGLGMVVAVQAVVIGYLLTSGGSTEAASIARPPAPFAAIDPVRPPELPAAVTVADPAAEETATVAGPPPIDVPAPAAPPPPARVLSGELTMVSPIELQVFEGGTLLGSSAAPLTLSEGPHTLEVVNEELGFRSQQSVTVVGGRPTAVTIAVPTGRVDINAVPWADVWIDGVSAGQTPIGNVTLSIGRHEILFRHPQLGERRETAVVKVDGVSRVSVVFQQ
ncbi:MAG TPA: hypothetical protein VMM93_05605 [Vicinamibacterales bacterium]|nr:hypothetical protein [Vicinamibacterales bacterium]